MLDITSLLSWLKNKQGKDMYNIDFETLLQNISKAIQDAQTAVNQYSVENYLKQFFESDANGNIHSAKSINMDVPNNKGGTSTITVPLVSLVNHNSLNISEIKIKLAITTKWDDEKQQLFVETQPLPNTNNDSNSNNVAYIEISFARDPIAEGTSRIVNKYTHIL